MEESWVKRTPDSLIIENIIVTMQNSGAEMKMYSNSFIGFWKNLSK